MVYSEVNVFAYLFFVASIIITCLWLMVLLLLFLDNKKEIEANKKRKRREYYNDRFNFAFYLLLLIWLSVCVFITIKSTNADFWLSIIQSIFSLFISAGMSYCLITNRKQKQNNCCNIGKFYKGTIVLTSVLILMLDIFNLIMIKQ